MGPPDRTRAAGASFTLVAALLWGASAPLAKLLLADASPLALAGLLYVGAGAGLLLLRTCEAILRRRRAPGAAAQGAREAALRPADYGILAAALASGGVLAPYLLMFGLERVSGVTGSLLLNLEAPFTIFLAVAFFSEHLGWREVGAAVLILIGAGIVGYRPGEMRADWSGVLAVAGASLSWAVDSNLTQRLSLRDPIAVILVKGLGGGGLMLGLASLEGSGFPRPALFGPALLVGFFSYGVSAVLWMRGLRILGAARVAAFFATAPFMGAVAAIPLLGERLERADLTAMALMGAGVALLLGERHAHLHAHEAIDHDHAHVHDEHHRHDHEGAIADPSLAHAHPHRHAPLVHEHPHVSDMHHRHRH